MKGALLEEPASVLDEVHPVGEDQAEAELALVLGAEALLEAVVVEVLVAEPVAEVVEEEVLARGEEAQDNSSPRKEEGERRRAWEMKVERRVAWDLVVTVFVQNAVTRSFMFREFHAEMKNVPNVI